MVIRNRNVIQFRNLRAVVEPSDNFGSEPTPPPVVIPKDSKPNPLDTPPAEPVVPTPPAEPPIENPPAEPVVEEIEFEEVDGTVVKYKLDKDGNALNTDGTVFKSKTDIDALLSASAPENTLDIKVEDIAKLSGINPLNDRGEALTFEPTVEGLAQREVAIAQQSGDAGYEQAINDLYATYPQVPQLIKHIQLYGNLDNFGKSVSYSDIKLDKDNKEQHKNIIIEAEILAGKDLEDAKELADMYVANATSYKQAEKAHKYILGKESERDAIANAEIQSRQEIAQREAEAFYGVTRTKEGKLVALPNEDTIYDKIVNKGKIGEFTIPATGLTVNIDGKQQKLSRADLFNYMSVIDNNIGTTRAMAMEQTYLRDKDKYILHYLGILTGYNYSELIKDAVGIEKINNIRRIRIKETTTPTDNTKGLKVKMPYAK